MSGKDRPLAALRAGLFGTSMDCGFPALPVHAVDAMGVEAIVILVGQRESAPSARGRIKSRVDLPGWAAQRVQFLRPRSLAHLAPARASRDDCGVADHPLANQPTAKADP